MGVHSLGSNASIEVLSVRGSFASLTPNMGRNELGEKLLQFSKPTDRRTTAVIKFRFKGSNLPAGWKNNQVSQ